MSDCDEKGSDDTVVTADEKVFKVTEGDWMNKLPIALW